MGEATRKIGVTEQTYYRWRRSEPGTIGGYKQRVEFAIKKALVR